MAREWYMAKSGILHSVFNVKVALSTDDYKRLKQLARRDGMPVSEYIRQAAEDGIYSAILQKDEEDE